MRFSTCFNSSVTKKQGDISNHLRQIHGLGDDGGIVWDLELLPVDWLNERISAQSGIKVRVVNCGSLLTLLGVLEYSSELFLLS